jgi:MerR family transcriptional regulator, redox-sensitive transcriptional activator SoxR
VVVDELTIGQVAARAGVAPSALRYYEDQGLVTASRTPGGARRYPRSVLRRLAFVRAAQNVGLSLGEVREALATLPEGRPPTARDWARLSSAWRERLDEQIAALERLRDGLTSCIGCGCLSLTRCRLYNPSDVAAAEGAGARLLPPALRRVPPTSNAR